MIYLLLVLLLELLGKFYVLLLSLLLGHALELLPGLPLVFGLEVKNARLRSRVVTNGGLLV
jgi:hypothetical protein